MYDNVFDLQIIVASRKLSGDVHLQMKHSNYTKITIYLKLKLKILGYNNEKVNISINFFQKYLVNKLRRILLHFVFTRIRLQIVIKFT